jgi:hypothetical protein
MKGSQAVEIQRVASALRVLGMSSRVDAGQLLSDIIDTWGGTKKLANEIKLAYDAAPPGSMVRQRFFEMIQRLIINNTDRDISKDIDPSEFSDAELAEAATGLLNKIMGDPNAEKEVAESQRSAVEDELQRPDRERDSGDGGLEDAGPPDGGWDEWGQ